jgi:hypothetical protein
MVLFGYPVRTQIRQGPVDRREALENARDLDQGFEIALRGQVKALVAHMKAACPGSNVAI